LLARTAYVNHPSGISFETPLLVPSFSSKGFRTAGKSKSELRFLVDYSREFIEESVLVSALDLAYGFLPKPKELPHPSVTFIDSGGYEVSDDHDLPSVYRFPAPNLDWTQEKLEEQYSKWPKQYPAIFVSFDSPKQRSKIGRQAKQAADLLHKFPHQLGDFLIKPESASASSIESCLEKIHAQPEILAPFSIVGVTEKDLGDRFSARLKNVVKLRKALDRVGVHAPIHVFGSLDPLSSCLYFLAGAEIFDGLTWLRYRYDRGVSTYLMSHGLLTLDLEARDQNVIAQAIAKNLSDLRDLKFQMKNYCRTGDIESFRFNREILTKARDMIRNEGGE